jgi:hypothetical protein
MKENIPPIIEKLLRIVNFMHSQIGDIFGPNTLDYMLWIVFLNVGILVIVLLAFQLHIINEASNYVMSVLREFFKKSV